MHRMTMAQACGEEPMPGLSFIPGEDFDPYDEDEREVVKLAMDIDRGDRMAALESENAILRRDLQAMQDRQVAAEDDHDERDDGGWRTKCCGADYDCTCD